MKRIAMPDVISKTWSQARSNLSKTWRGDADGLRRRATHAEQKAAEAIHKSWSRLKPKAVQVEHKLHEAWLTKLRKIRDSA